MTLPSGTRAVANNHNDAAAAPNDVEEKKKQLSDRIKVLCGTPIQQSEQNLVILSQHRDLLGQYQYEVKHLMEDLKIIGSDLCEVVTRVNGPPDTAQFETRCHTIRAKCEKEIARHLEKFVNIAKERNKEQTRRLLQATVQSNNPKRRHPGRRANFPPEAVAILKKWIVEHKEDPYPNATEKELLAKATLLTYDQISNWFINARMRKWKPSEEKS